jgi:hypothetical protein
LTNISLHARSPWKAITEYPGAAELFRKKRAFKKAKAVSGN